MFKKLVLMIMVASFVLIGTTVIAMNKGEKGGEEGIIIIGGRVTEIKGNVVTVVDEKGKKRAFEVGSVKGIEKGVSAWCEEDCGRSGLKIGDKIIKVKRVIQ